MNILITGFEPFGPHLTNPTQEVISLLPKSIKGHPLHKVLLPVLYQDAFEIVKQQIDTLNPGIIILLGLAGDRDSITPERVAINMNDASIPDNNDVLHQNKTIVDQAPAAYFSTLPLQKIIDVLDEKHIKAKISNTAGLYVCNDVMFRTLHYVDQMNLHTLAGFIHVPQMSEITESKTSMPLTSILEGVIDAIKCCL